MTNQPSGPAADANGLQEFVERCLDGLGHQVRGNSEPFLAVWSHADDVAILGAAGSYAQGWDHVRDHLLGTSRSLDWTGLSVERLLVTSSGELALTVVLEHMTRNANGKADSRTLRATQGYRRENGDWRLILRHANAVTSEDEAREQTLQQAGAQP
ncbi:MAG TPA: nuclear transport factor 2 family protein [Solirubrobacteraceae bacterium]|nr:nuclear transport factor 2 family protein [Solirubrobacteraceae bacterium]